MGIMARIGEAFKALVGGGKKVRRWPVVGTPAVAAAYWTDNRIEQSRHFRYWVYVAIDCLATKVGQLPPHVGRRSKAGGKKSAAPGRRTGGSAFAKQFTAAPQADDVETVEPGHPLVELLAHPNPVDTAFDLFYEIALFERLQGTAYLWVIRNGAGMPAELWVIPSHWVTPRSAGDKLVSFYEIRPIENFMSSWQLDADDVICLRSKSPISKVDGFAKLTAGARWIDAAEAIDGARRSSAQQGINPGAVIELGEQYQDPDVETLARIEAKIMAKLAGSDQHGRPIILPPGAKMNRFTLAPVEMDFVASADQMRDTVLALFGTPKTVVGITEEVNYASMNASLASYAINVINPFLARLGQCLTKELAPEFGDDLVVWWPDCAPPDPTVVLAQEAFEMQWGLATVNEKRVARGWQPYPHGGDDPLLPAGLSPVGWGTGEEYAAPYVPPDLQEQADAGDEAAKAFAGVLRDRLVNKVATNGTH